MCMREGHLATTLASLPAFTSWMGTVAALGFGAYTFSEFIALLSGEKISINGSPLASSFFLLRCTFIGTHVGGKAQQMLTFTNAAGLSFVILCFSLGHRVDATALQQTVEKLQLQEDWQALSALHSRPFLYLMTAGTQQVISPKKTKIRPKPCPNP